MLIFLLSILLALVLILLTLTFSRNTPLYSSLHRLKAWHITNHTIHCGQLTPPAIISFFDLHLLLMSNDIAKVRETLHQDVLACAEIISDVQFLATKVISIVLVKDASLALYNKVDTIGILWQIISLLNVFVNLLEDLTEAIILILDDLEVTLVLRDELLFCIISCGSACSLFFLLLLCFTERLGACDGRTVTPGAHRIIVAAVFTDSIIVSGSGTGRVSC